MTERETLRKLSARIGADPLLVQAAGGNTSIKQDGVMWIKASGTWLKDALVNDIFVPLDLARLTNALALDDPDCESCTSFVRTDLNPTGLRPSIETSVHGLMPQAVVLHVHCVNTIACAIHADAESLLAEKLQGVNWAFIPYARPGLMLSKAIRQRLKPGCNVLVLGNHGLVVAAETVAQAETLLNEIATKLQRPARPINNPNMVALRYLSQHTDYVPATNPETHAAALDPIALALGCEKVFYPDHVVFLGTKIPSKIEPNALAIAIPGMGVLIHKSAKAAVEPMVRCMADVFRRVEPAANLSALTENDIGQLLNWDAEKYRQTLGSLAPK
jgi:rhamnose utilization protein RhaD (predicted bifunctional aldolase and dehydrogenase)